MANNVILVKRTSVSGRQPNTTSSGNTQYIGAGGLALNMTDKILYSSDGTSVIEVGSNNTSHNISTNNLTVGTTVYVVSNGNIGIGNSSPTKKLHFFDAANGQIRFAASADPTYYREIGRDNLSTGNFYISRAQGAAVVRDLTIDVSGNCGIGNTSPSHKLRVDGSLSVSTGIHANGSLGANMALMQSNGSVAFWGPSLTVGTTAPSSPAVGDLWVDTN